MSLDLTTPYSVTVAEVHKYAPIINDTSFPAVSVTRTVVRDAAPSLSSIDVYPKFAQLVYVVNSGQIGAGQNGAVFINTTGTNVGPYSLIKTVSATTFTGISGNVTGLAGITVPANFEIQGNITAFSISTGSVLAWYL